jgi:multidrug resistance efflux pump
MINWQAFLTFLGRLAKIGWAVLLFPVRMGRALLRSARAWILFLLLVIVALVAYYILADLYTPFTTDAYVQAYVIQVAPRVAGQVVRVHVKENQAVKKGDRLFEIDPTPFEHRVNLLIAKRVNAVQRVAQLESELVAAKAEHARLVAEEAYAHAVYKQEEAIYQQKATTDRKFLDALQKDKAAQAALEQSAAQVSKAGQALAARVGAEHALVAEVEAQLAEARLNLDWTRVDAPCDGLITDLQLREGAFSHAGQSVMTVIDTSRWLVVANFRENSLTWLREGQPARIAFRSVPGEAFDAKVISIGRGVSQGQGVPSGQLPDVKVPASWVPPAQRFQVRLALNQSESVPLRVGMTGSVVVYTESEGMLNDITAFFHRLIAWLYYL